MVGLPGLRLRPERSDYGKVWKRLPRAGRRQSTSRHVHVRLGPVSTEDLREVTDYGWNSSQAHPVSAPYLPRTAPNAFTIASMCDVALGTPCSSSPHSPHSPTPVNTPPGIDVVPGRGSRALGTQTRRDLTCDRQLDAKPCSVVSTSLNTSVVVLLSLLNLYLPVLLYLIYLTKSDQLPMHGVSRKAIPLSPACRDCVCVCPARLGPWNASSVCALQTAMLHGLGCCSFSHVVSFE